MERERTHARWFACTHESPTWPLHTAAGARWKSGLDRLAAEAAVARAMRATKDFMLGWLG